MTSIYRVPLVETVTVYKDRTVTERVPAGCEEVEPGRVWSTLKLGDGSVLLGTSEPLASLPKGAQQLSSSKDEQLSAQTIAKLSNDLGENLDTTRHKNLDTLLLDLLVVTADGEKRKPLEPVKTREGSELRVYLANELVAFKALPSGGAEITDNFNRGSLGAGWEDSAWYSGAPVAILDSIELGTTAPGGSDLYAGRHLTALSTAAHYVQANQTIGGLSSRTFGLMVRMNANDSPSSGYQGGIDFSASEYAFWEVDTGYGRSKIASSATWTGDSAKLLRLEANGSSLELFWDGVSRLTTTDATYSDLFVGAWFFVNGDQVRLDNFEASPLGGGGGGAVDLAGIGAASSAGRAEPFLAADLAGRGSAASSGTANCLNLADLAGSGNASSTGSATLLLAADLQGHGDATSAGSGNALLAADLQGHGDACSGGRGDLLLGAALTGHGDACSGGTGDVSTSAYVDVTGHGDACSAGTADLVLVSDLAGSGHAASSGTGACPITADLQGAGTCASSGTGTLQLLADLAGTGGNAVEGAASLLAQLALAGSGNSATAGLATLVIVGLVHDIVPVRVRAYGTNTRVAAYGPGRVRVHGPDTRVTSWEQR